MSNNDRRFSKKNIQCSLCDSVISDARESHNALPITPFRCCAKCNDEKVIPARLGLFFNNSNKTKQEID